MSLLHRLWRKLPPNLRREALFSTMAALAPRPAADAPAASEPFTVAGYFRAPSGLGEGARRLADMLEAAGAQVQRADLTAALRQGPPGPGPVLTEGSGTLFMHVNGPMLPWGLVALGRRRVAGKRVIAFWNWELPVLPQDWQRGFRFVHEIWVSSRFTAEAVRRAGTVPVQVVHYPIPDPVPAAISRADLGLPENAFIAVSVFDAASVVERKNPLGSIAAHHRAFGDSPDHVLVLKTYNTAMGGAAWRAVAAAAAERPNVRIIDREMSRAEVWGLLQQSDVLLSLHRAEGVGLSLAEAMRLGKPVVATGWSGNMDFMDSESGILVPWRLVPSADERGVYSTAGAEWAEPDIDAAAAGLQRLAADAGYRQALGQRGQQAVAGLVPEQCGRHALAALGLGSRDWLRPG